MTTSLEERITRLEDIEAIKQLKARYCEGCDDDHNPDKVAATFAKNGIWNGSTFGVAEGREAIRELFSGFKDVISFSQHNIINPILEINGDHATGIWYVTGPFIFHNTGTLHLMSARYDDEYTKLGGEWKHLSLKGTMRLLREVNSKF